VIVGVVLEQLGSGFEDVAVVLDESFRTCLGLPNLAFNPIKVRFSTWFAIAE
jgi:hypothetical protein